MQLDEEHQVLFQHFLQLHKQAVVEEEHILFQTVRVLIQGLLVVVEVMLVQVQALQEEQVIHLRLAHLKVTMVGLLIELLQVQVLTKILQVVVEALML